MLLALSINSKAQLNYLFSATSRPYVPVTGGITPHLISDYAPWEVEDEGLARIPIGFTFNYNNKNYTEANVSVNGFITLGDFFSTYFNFHYFSNNLANGPYSYPGERPVIAPLWDDLVLTDTLNLVYKTTGHAPFRVFTIEWKKAKWVYESLAPVLSIELKLYETTNIIEFHYKDEGSLPDPRYSYASIGITSAYANRDFISLQNTSSHPDISLLKSNDSLTVKPADNQVYRFTPSFVKMPAPLEPSLSYTNNKVSFKLQSGEFNSYEYAITHSPIPPSSGTRTFSPSVIISSLSPATTYYIYARSSFFGWFNSQWACDSFTTAVNPVALPYKQDFEDVIYPKDLRKQDFRDTFYQYDPIGFQGPTPFSFFEGQGSSLFYFQIDSYDADLWLFTPGLNLIAGKTYNLKFSYASLWEYDPSNPASLEVKYGKATGANAMTSGLLFKKTDITNSDALKDTAIEFSPYSSGIYYFGFHNLSLFQKGALLLDNIDVSEKTATAVTAYVLNGKTDNSDNLLNWSVNNNEAVTAFEVQRSDDGINFRKIGEANAASANNNSAKKNPVFKVIKNAPGLISGDKHANESDLRNPGFKFQRSNDGINFTKIDAAKSKSAADVTKAKTGMEYTDHQPVIGSNFYRLSQIKNGKVIYSNVIKLEKNLQIDAIYPNPARDVVSVKVQSLKALNSYMVVTDVSGKIFVKKMIPLASGINNLQVEISQLPAGTFILKIASNDGTESVVKRFVKE